MLYTISGINSTAVCRSGTASIKGLTGIGKVEIFKGSPGVTPKVKVLGGCIFDRKFHWKGIWIDTMDGRYGVVRVREF